MKLADFKKITKLLEIPDNAEITFRKYINSDVIALIFTHDLKEERINIKECLHDKYS